MLASLDFLARNHVIKMKVLLQQKGVFGDMGLFWTGLE